MNDERDSAMDEASNKNTELSLFKKLLPYLALAILLSMSVGLWRHFENTSAKKEQRRFNEYITEKTDSITGRLEKYMMVLQGGAGVFIASGQVSRAEWRAYIDYRQIRTVYPGVQGMGFSKIIRPAELAQHIRSIRAEGFPDYTVRPDGERDEYTAIIFLEPFDARNQGALGYDMFSEPVRRAAMTRARDTGEVSLSGRVTLVQEKDEDIQPGFLIYVPVYPHAITPNSPEERRAAIQGYVYASFRMRDFMQGIFPAISNKIDIEVYDGADLSPAALMYDSYVSPGSPDERRRPMFTATRTLDLYGHQWTLKLETTPLFEADADAFIPKTILGGGIIISLLIFFMLKMLETAGARAFSLARKMTAALRESEARYQILNDNLPVGVSLIGPNMEILAANAVKRRWFPEAEPNTHLLCFTVYHTPPRTEPCEGCPVVLALRDGQAHTAERQAVTSLGERVLRISALPIKDADGKIIHVHETVEDITERKRAEIHLARQDRLLEGINQVLREAMRCENETELAVKCLNIAQELTGSAFGFINELNAAGTVDALAITYPGWAACQIPNTQAVLMLKGLPVRGIWACTIKRGEPVIANDPAFHPDRVGVPPDHPPLVRFLGVPLMREGKSVGLIGLANKQSDYDLEDQRTAESLASAFVEVLLRRRVELQVRAAESRYRLLTENLGDAIWTIDLEGRLTYISSAIENLIGYTPEEVMVMPMTGYIVQEDYEAIMARLAEELAKPPAERARSQTIKVRYKTKDGRLVHVEFNASWLLDKQGNVMGVQGSTRDITERVKMEKQITESRKMYKSVVDTQQEMICRYLPDTTLVFVNDAYCRIFGKSRGELLGQKYLMVLSPEKHEEEIASLNRLTPAKPSARKEYSILLPDGSTVWQEWTHQALFDENGNVIEMQGVGHDITDRKWAEDGLRASEARFRSAMNHSPVGMALVSPEGRWLDVNAALCGLLAYSKEEFLQTTFQDITHADDLDADLAYVRQMLAGEIDTYRMEKRYIHKDGHVVWAVLNVSLVKKEDSSPDYFISQILDITAEKQAEQERIARQAAETASRHKSLFLSNMSHEIRTPMNAILGFAQVLERDSSLSPGQREQVHTINRSGHHLLRLIDDILDISRIEAGRIELKPAVFNLGDLLDDVEMMFRSRAEAKGLQLLVEREDAWLPAWVRGDEGKLRQILVNLLGNAVKFTQSGGVCLRARSEPAADHPDEDGKPLRLVFEVEDSGPGIPASDRERIFEAFDQAEAGARAGGTGLGLAISRRLVEMMGGKLTVESVVGKGSCFRFEAMFEPAQAMPETEKPESRRVVGLEPGSGPWRILVVDDVATNRDLLRVLLLPLGFETREAKNGQDAIDLFEEWSPHAVLMDMRMPVMDGYEATRRIKATEASAATPVIAVTASVFKDSEEEVLATGVSAYLRKPFRPEELYKALGKFLGLRYVYADEPAEVPQPHKAVALSPESLAALPRELVRAMQEAVAEGYVARLSELISRVELLDSTAAQGLKALAGRYDYTKLTELLKKGESDYE